MTYTIEQATKVLNRIRRSFPDAQFHEDGISLQHRNGTNEILISIPQHAFKEFVDSEDVEPEPEVPEPEPEPEPIPKPTINWSSNFENKNALVGDTLSIGLGQSKDLPNYIWKLNGLEITPVVDTADNYSIEFIEESSNNGVASVEVFDANGIKHESKIFNYTSFTPPTTVKIKESNPAVIGSIMTLTASFTGAKANGVAGNSLVGASWATDNLKNTAFNGSDALKLTFDNISEEDDGTYTVSATIEGINGIQILPISESFIVTATIAE